MKVLVTGAAGRLGLVACKALLERGHAVRATDHRFVADHPLPLQVADLCAELSVYPLLEGMDALVHLGNHPNLLVAASPQCVLSQNVAMNANVFRAAFDLGVGRIVFASSLQAMVPFEDGKGAPAPYALPYLPLDGRPPTNPGSNFYGLSKEFGERMLQVLCGREPKLCATALRFPHLAGEWWASRLKQPLVASALNWCEGLTYLEFSDAAAVIALALERQQPGYHQYFPAQALGIAGYTVEDILAEFYGGTRLLRPAAEITSLVDHSQLEAELGFRPSAATVVELKR